MFTKFQFLVLLTPLFLTPAAPAGVVTLNFSGTIRSVSDSTGQNILSIAAIAAGSTFQGSVQYDTASVPVFSNASLGQYDTITSALTLTIDAFYTFSNIESDAFVRNNSGAPFYDELVIRQGSTGGNSFPITFNASDNLLSLTLRDTTETAFSDTSLPNSLDLTDFSPYSFSKIFIRSDLNRSLGRLWTISGEITSLSGASLAPVPEPTALAFWLLGGLALFAGRWRRGRSAKWIE